MEYSSETLSEKEQQLKRLGLQRLFVLVLDFGLIRPTDRTLNQFLLATCFELFKRKNQGINDRLMVVMTSAPSEQDCVDLLKLYGLEPEKIETIESSDAETDEETIALYVSSWVKSIAGAISLSYSFPFCVHWSGIAPDPSTTLDSSDFYRDDIFGTLARLCIDGDDQTTHESELYALAIAQFMTGFDAALGNNFYDFYDPSMLDSLDGFQLAAEASPTGWYQGIDEDELYELKKEAFLKAVESRRMIVIDALTEFFGGSWVLFYGLYRHIYSDFSADIQSDMVRLNLQVGQDCRDGNPELLNAWELLTEGNWDFADD